MSDYQTPMIARGNRVSLARWEWRDATCDLGHKHQIKVVVEHATVWLPHSDARRGLDQYGRKFFKADSADGWLPPGWYRSGNGGARENWDYVSEDADG